MQTLYRSFFIFIALAIVSSVLVHGSIAELSIFHGLIIHPIALLSGLSLLSFAVKTQQKK
ncbi:hypothetical protein [Thalassotalea atypica]|uniref:hypothetical protein n=1 Tax=Thalassotalea atypica TaxID=2054316 RepID=UPI002572908C|nr:hypothetical protein [Thalassotalea atypica]